jgi:hypothetical protein
MARQLFVIGCRDALGTVRLGLFARYKAVMPNRVRIIKHEAVPGCGSFEVRFADGRPSRFWYWDDLPSRRLRPDMLTREQALEQAKAFARAARDGIEKTMKFAADRPRPPTMLSRDGALAARQDRGSRF